MSKNWKGYLRYISATVGIQLFLTFILILTVFDDGPNDIFTLNNILAFILKYLFGFPLGFLFEAEYDLRLLLWSPLNSAIQYFGYKWIRSRINQKEQ